MSVPRSTAAAVVGLVPGPRRPGPARPLRLRGLDPAPYQVGLAGDDDASPGPTPDRGGDELMSGGCASTDRRGAARGDFQARLFVFDAIDE